MSHRLITDREVPIPRPRPRRGFLRGLMRLAELGGAFERRRALEHLSLYLAPDDVALAQDWERVGMDLRYAFERAARDTGVPEDAALALAERSGE